MTGRPKQYDDNLILDKAIEVFRSKCYDAASTDEILAAMGIGKGSFYLHFKGGKEELYQLTLRRFAEKLNRRIEKEMESSGNAIGYIKDLFYKSAMTASKSQDSGCYYGNALVQLSSEHAKTKAIAVELLKDLRQLFLKALTNAQQTGRINRQHDPETLSWHLLNFWNGINVTRRMEKSPTILKQLVDLSFDFLN